MRCEYCPLCPRDDTCGLFDEIGVEFEDGTVGCKTPRNRINKLEREHCEMLGNMGTDMGVEADFEAKKLDVAVAVKKAMHMIGMGIRKPYRRHGKLFYRPYRNYYDAPPCGDEYLDALPSFLIRKTQESKNEGVWYELTREGLDWLGRQLNMTIHDEEE